MASAQDLRPDDMTLEDRVNDLLDRMRTSTERVEERRRAAQEPEDDPAAEAIEEGGLLGDEGTSVAAEFDREEESEAEAEATAGGTADADTEAATEAEPEAAAVAVAEPDAGGGEDAGEGADDPASATEGEDASAGEIPAEGAADEVESLIADALSDAQSVGGEAEGEQAPDDATSAGAAEPDTAEAQIEDAAATLAETQRAADEAAPPEGAGDEADAAGVREALESAVSPPPADPSIPAKAQTIDELDDELASLTAGLMEHGFTGAEPPEPSRGWSGKAMLSDAMQTARAAAADARQSQDEAEAEGEHAPKKQPGATVSRPKPAAVPENAWRAMLAWITPVLRDFLRRTAPVLMALSVWCWRQWWKVMTPPILRLLELIDLPLQRQGPMARRLVGYLAVWTLVLAVVLFGFILLRQAAPPEPERPPTALRAPG